LGGILDGIRIQRHRFIPRRAVQCGFAFVVYVSAAAGKQVVRELHAVRIAALPLHSGPGHITVLLNKFGKRDVFFQRFGLFERLFKLGLIGALIFSSCNTSVR
jgi:hypothetical protein